MNFSTIRTSLVFLIIGLCLLSPQSQANVRSANTEARLIAELETLAPDTEFWIALELKMDSGWHTYWKNPGDSGLETAIKWNLPAGFKAGDIHWPYPKRIELPPLVTYGYEGTVYLLTKIRTPFDLKTGEETVLQAKADWLACEKICIPGKGEFALSFPVTAKPEINTETAPLFAEAKTRLPINESVFQINGFESKNEIYLEFNDPPYPLNDIEFFPDESGVLKGLADQKLISLPNKIELRLEKAERKNLVKTLTGVLVNTRGWRGEGSEKAWRINVDLGEAPQRAPQSSSGAPLTLPFAFLFAFLGGMILNLMPCVLPVLSIKVISLMEAEKHESKHPLFHGLLYTAGVLTTFWILAALLILFRAGGEQIGWGFQLQSPIFVFILAALFLFLSFNLLGVFEIGLFATRFSSGKFSLSAWQSFASGILSVIVATPCTAPFMGAALGFAITQSTLTALLVFTGLGLGLAAPYLLISAFPGFGKIIPEPGPWMVKLKKVLALLLFATTLWLLWVLSLQMHSGLLFWIVLAGLLVFTVGTYFYGKGSKAAWLFFVIGILISIIALNYDQGARQSQTMESKLIDWEVYSESRLEELLQTNKPIFIDFTAAWCLTCQVNERIALETREVADAFTAYGITALKADWTRKDQAIADALAKYGRNSIPLYVLYRGDADNSYTLLPEIITKQMILKILEEKLNP